MSFPSRSKVEASVGPPPPAAPRASSSAPGRGVFYPAHSPAALRAGEPAARPAVQRFLDSPAALRAGEPAAHRTALSPCLNANSPDTLRAGDRLAKGQCPPPDTQSPSGWRL